MDDETRRKLLSRRGYQGRRISQIGARRWVAETRLANKWRVLCDEKLSVRIFATAEDALQASEKDRLEWEAMKQRLEKEG